MSEGGDVEETVDITLRVNGTLRTFSAPARRLLHDALRHDLRLTGTHAGCEHGVCGCCTVLLDGDPVRACLMLAVGAQGHDVTTVEGLAAADGALHPVQRAFQECHGLQCGFCTPGFLMATCGLLREHPDPSDDEIVEGISGNLCRCTGYQNIVASVRRAAELLRGDGTPAPVAQRSGDLPSGGTDDDGSGAGPEPAEVHPRATGGQPVPFGAVADATPGTARDTGTDDRPPDAPRDEASDGAGDDRGTPNGDRP